MNRDFVFADGLLKRLGCLRLLGLRPLNDKVNGQAVENRDDPAGMIAVGVRDHQGIQACDAMGLEERNDELFAFVRRLTGARIDEHRLTRGKTNDRCVALPDIEHPHHHLAGGGVGVGRPDKERKQAGCMKNQACARFFTFARRSGGSQVTAIKQDEIEGANSPPRQRRHRDTGPWNAREIMGPVMEKEKQDLAEPSEHKADRDEQRTHSDHDESQNNCAAGQPDKQHVGHQSDWRELMEVMGEQWQ